MSFSIDALHHFSLEKIADSGQAFRWLKDGDSWVVPVMGKTAILNQVEDLVSIECPDGDDDFWYRYLSLDVDYDLIFDELLGTSAAQDKALAFSDGIRVLRQPFFESSVSFIISQNNNIRNITNSVRLLCGDAGSQFPSAEEIVAKLAQDTCKTGYRAPYIVSFCEKYISGGFKDVEKYEVLFHVDGSGKPPYKEMSDRLCSETGIGPKVAACICLFSLGYDEAVPRDVWIKRLEESYDVKWHPDLAGIQQQFLFAAIRAGVI